MAVTTISGATGSLGTNAILANQKVVDISDKIYLLEPNAAPLYVLVSKIGKDVTINPSFSWLEDELQPSWTTFAVSAASNATAITAANAYINKYDLLKVPSTGEVMLCTSVTSTAVTVIRAYGTTSAASAAAAADILVLGPAFAEGSVASDLVTKTTQTAEVTNYTQLFRKSCEVTRTLANTELYGGPERNNQRRKKGIELMRDFERMFLFGELKQDTATGLDSSLTHARRTMKGINSFISTNATAAGGVLTESEFESFLRTVFRYGGSSRYLFCAPLVLSVISQWAQGKLQTFSKDKTYGIAITQYLSPQGSVNLIREFMLENAGGVSSTSYYGGYAFALALEELKYRYLQNRDVQMETDIQANGDDTYKDQYIAEISMEFHQERMHGKLTGVTG